MSEEYLSFVYHRSRIVRRATIEKALLFGGFVVAIGFAITMGEVSLPALAKGLVEIGRYFSRLTPEIRPSSAIGDVTAWYWGFNIWANAALDTIVIAFVSTAIATALAVPLSFLASRNLTNVVVYHLVRRTLEIIRTVPSLVYALVFVLAFGLGPMAGVLAIALYSTGSNGKVFSEINETIDPKQVESVIASGGSWFAVVRFGVFPQVLPSFISYGLLRLEKNIRSASVIGFVGAGGIGQELYLSIRSFQYTDVSAITLMIVSIVVCSDIFCDYMRKKVI
jgi:phosphonate transport system permease protein